MNNLKLYFRLFAFCCFSLWSAQSSFAQNCADYALNNVPENAIVAFVTGPNLSQFGGTPTWTITIDNQESIIEESTSLLLNYELLQQASLNNITLCFSWGEANTECDQSMCKTYHYNLATGILELVETTGCEASFIPSIIANGLVGFENTSYTEVGSAVYQWQFGNNIPPYYEFNTEYQYDASGPAEVCLQMDVYQENQQVCQDDTCLIVDIQLEEPVCGPGYSAFFVEVLTCCEADFPNTVFFALAGTDNETYITETIPVSTQAQSISTYETCIPAGCYELQFDFSLMQQMVQQTSYIAYGSDDMTNEEIIDTFEDLPWTSTFCILGDGTACPSAITAEQTSCNTFSFSLTEVASGDATVIWNFGDGSVSDQFAPVHQFEENGIYIVTALYTSNDCVDGVSLSLIAEVSCGSNCPETITTINSSTCGQYIFYVENTGPNTQMIWSAGDGSDPVIIPGEFVHQFESPGTYEVCTQLFSTNCPDGILLCTLVEVPECNISSCPDIINFEQIDCNTYFFNINDNNTGYALWDFGDGTTDYYYQGNPEHSYDENGVYVVTAEYFGPGCQAGVTLTVFVIVECAPEICPDMITFTEGQQCHQYLFEVNNWGETVYGDILWNFGDNEGYGQNEFLHMYIEPGNYEVCVEGTTEQCPSGFNLCAPLQVSACGGDSDEDGCPDWIWGYPLNDCGLWHFEAGLFEAENQNILWNWGDGTFSDGNTIVNHQYTEDGLYIVTLTYSSANCDQTTVIYTVQANACETANCPQEIWSGQGEDCGVMLFEAGGFVEGEVFIWYFGDGTQAEGGHFITHEYTEPGIYNVCCVMSNINCPAYQLCTTIEVESCGPECTNVALGIDSYVNEGGTPWLYFSVMNVNYEMITSGALEYTAQDPYFDTMLCLPDGCYYLTIDNNNPITPGEGLNIFISTGNENLMENAEIIYQDAISFTILFGVNSDCTSEQTCEALFEYTYNSTPGMVNFINNSTDNANTTSLWDFGNGETSIDWSPQAQYTENGVYEVCLTITDGDCTDIFCQNIVVENLPVICEDNLVEITVTGSFTSNTLEVIEVVMSQNNLPLDDWTLIYSNQQVSLTAEGCYPDGCYEFSYSTDVPVQADDLNVIIVSNNVTLTNVNLPVNQTSGSFVFGLNTDCTSFTQNIESGIEWALYPVPANHVLMFKDLTDESNHIEIFDIAGKMIYSTISFSKTLDVNTSEWAEGLYLARVVSGNRTTTRRFEIIH